jgi:hypothetical protein
MSFDCITRIRSYLSLGEGTDTEHSLGDVWFYIYGGMEKYVFSPENPFKFPVVWTMLFVFCAVLVLNYPIRDMLGIGAHYLVGGGSRSKWWISKVIWNVIATIIYHLIIFITIVVSCLVEGISLNNGLNVTMQQSLYEFTTWLELDYVTSIPVTVFLLPVVVSIAMNLFQMTLTLFINPTYSFIVNCVLMISSAYFMTPYMPYNYAMPLRYKWVYIYGFKHQYGFAVAFVIAAVSIVIGFIRFSKYDIIKKEDN